MMGVYPMNETTVSPQDGKLTRIEDSLDKARAGDVIASFKQGGVQFQTMIEVMEFAKLMSLAQEAVPPHCRGKPGVCLAICMQALAWRMEPFQVANKSY